MPTPDSLLQKCPLPKINCRNAPVFQINCRNAPVFQINCRNAPTSRLATFKAANRHRHNFGDRHICRFIANFTGMRNPAQVNATLIGTSADISIALCQFYCTNCRACQRGCQMMYYHKHVPSRLRKFAFACKSAGRYLAFSKTVQ